MALLDDIITNLITAGFATAKDTDIFKDFMPDEPDNCIAIYEYGGLGPAAFTNVGVRSIQVSVRNLTVAGARDLCWNIYSHLFAEDLRIDIGTRKCLISMRGGPLKGAPDEAGRRFWRFSFGLTTQIDS